MDSTVQTSFIPKKPLDDRGNVRRGEDSLGGLISLICIFIFVASIVLAGGAFAYQNFLTSAIAGKAHQLQTAEDAFDPSVIQDLVRTDQRMSNAETLLQKHVAPSAIFGVLSGLTLQNVQLLSFSYALQDDGSATIMLTGTADTFSTMALQSDQFSASKVLKDVIFSDIAINSSTNKVTFSVSATVDPSVINYASVLAASGAAAQSVQQQAPTTPDTSASSTTATGTAPTGSGSTQ